MSRLSVLIAAVLLAGAPATVATQVQIVSPGAELQRPGAPPRDGGRTPAPQTGTARIRGRVTTADANAPLRRAQVMIVSPEGNIRRATTTDAQGRYEFSELPAGRYLVTASKGGYVTLQAGQRRPFEPGNPMTLGDGQTLANVDVALPRGSVIAGRVTDEFGEPIAMAQVQAQRYEYRPGGQRRLTFAGGPFVMTDDLGQFRVYGLMPGEYVISAVVRNMGMAMGTGGGSESIEGFAPTFYPGTANPAEAQPVVVGLGQEFTVQLSLVATRLARVSGTAVDSTGKPASGAMVMLRSGSSDGAMFATGGAQVAADGSFTLPAVPPGEHFIDIRPQPRAPDARPEFASVPITVAGENIAGLRVTTAPGATIRGRVVFEGDGPRAGNFGPLRVTPQNADPQQLPIGVMMGGGPFAAANGVIADDGTFELGGQSGELLFRVNAAGTWMLKQVVIDGKDVTDVPYAVAGTETVSDVRIVLTNRLTELSGTVTDDRGQPVKDYVLVLLPAALADGVSPLRFTRAIRPDQDGVYRTRSLPPGAYVAAAVETVEQGGEWNPEFQQRVRAVARSVTIREGEKATLDLELAAGL